MRNFFALIAVLFLFSTIGVSQDHFIPLDRNNTEAKVLENSTNNLRMSFSLDGISGKDVTSKNGQDFTELYFGNGYYTGKVGSPKIPAFKRLIQIPFGAEVEVNVIGYSKKKMSLKDIGISNQIFPVQPSLRKDKTIDEVPFEYNNKVYNTDGFTNEKIAQVEILGTMRGVRIARIEVAPVQYNPVNGEIVVFNDIEVELVYKGANKEKTQSAYQSTYSPFFEQAYSTLANPYSKSVFDDHPDLTSYPVHMLIVSDREFEETLQPYIEWKTKKGFHVEVAYTDDIGTTSNAVKEYVHAAYNDATAENPAPSFLVIAGDVDQVPASETGSESGKLTDLYYASVDGDYFPEMYYGRLSAQTTEQLENIINKILYYEQYQFEDPTYLDNATLIAGVDGNWNPKVGQPTIKYGTENYFNSDNGFNTVWGYGIADDPNNPNNSSGYTGCYDDEKIAVSLINYTAHCMETVWGDPQLTISDINSMTNSGKYPLSVGNCCLSAEFGTDECVGEAWIRAEDKGAVTYIGSSPSSYWFEDFYWSVGAFPISGDNDGYVPTFEETTFGAYDAPYHSNYNTAGGLVFVGNLAVTEVDLEGYPSHSSPTYYWQAYNVLGDPSLMPFLTQGDENNVSHMEIMPIGLDTYLVAAEPGSYVAISKDGALHGAALVDETGEVEVPIDPILEGGDVDIVVTRNQTIPYIAQVPAAALEGPYIAVDEYNVNDENENDNGLVDFGEEFTVNISLKNVGADDAQDVSASLSGTDEFITLNTTDAVSFGDISAEEGNNTASYNNAYSFSVSDDVPDQHQATFVLTITDGNDTWESDMKFTANAPVIQLSASKILDDPQDISFSSSPIVSVDNGEEYSYTIEVTEMLGNGNGVLDADETAGIEIKTANNGNSDLKNAHVTLSSSSEYITISTDEVYINSLAVGEEIPNEFTIQVHEDTPIGTVVDFDFTIVYAGYEDNVTISLPVGLQIEDFETGDLNAYPWQKSGDADWFVQESEFHEGAYAAQAGGINDNQISTLEITVDVLEDSNISFYQKVSSEESYDYLKFYVDDQMIQEWSGSNDWSLFEHAVTAGTRKFTWSYEKDGSIDGGDDTAWLDYIVFPPHSQERKSSVAFTATQVPEWLSLTDNSDGTATLEGTAPGEYVIESIIISAEKGDITKEQAFEIEVGSLSGISDQNIDSNIYPNPFTNSIKITNASSIANVKITNVLGQIVKEINPDASDIEIQTAELTEGVYLIILETKKGETFSKRMIKE